MCECASFDIFHEQHIYFKLYCTVLRVTSAQTVIYCTCKIIITSGHMAFSPSQSTKQVCKQLKAFERSQSVHRALDSCVCKSEHRTRHLNINSFKGVVTQGGAVITLFGH